MDISIIGGTGEEGFGLTLRLAKAGNHVTIGSRTLLIRPFSIAMPTSAAMMLFETDLTLASRVALRPFA